jgi:preprotein translocase subunit YajC
MAVTAAPGDAAPVGGQFGGQFWMFLVAMIAIMYFIVIRPNSVRERERREMLNALSKGDKIVTAGGILGTIVGVDEHKAVVRIADDPLVKIEVLRTSIGRVINKEDS